MLKLYNTNNNNNNELAQKTQNTLIIHLSSTLNQVQFCNIKSSYYTIIKYNRALTAFYTNFLHKNKIKCIKIKIKAYCLWQGYKFEF